MGEKLSLLIGFLMASMLSVNGSPMTLSPEAKADDIGNNSWPDYSSMWLNSENAPSPMDFPSPSKVKLNRSEADLEQPVWYPCEHTSRTSYLNFTFSPYPIRRRQALNVSLEGWLDEDIPQGTILEMYSWNYNVRFIPGPNFSIDVCEYLGNQFPNSSQPIKCPLSQWATLLVMNALQENAKKRSGGDSRVDFTDRVPWFIVPGLYRTTVQLRAYSQVMTCATALLRIK